MQLVKFPHGLLAVVKCDPQSGGFRPPQTASGRALKTVQHSLLSKAEINDVAVKSLDWRGAWPVATVAPAFKIAPVAFPAGFHSEIMEFRAFAIRGPQSVAKIGERERDTAAARKDA